MENEKLITVIFVCPVCGKEHYLHNVPASLVERVEHRRENGEYIQDILKDYNPFDREKFISGCCDECQQIIFVNPEEE